MDSHTATQRQGRRSCTNCGKPVEQLPYQYWLFQTCTSCAAEKASTKTNRKWRYFPKWHFNDAPSVPKCSRDGCDDRQEFPEGNSEECLVHALETFYAEREEVSV